MQSEKDIKYLLLAICIFTMSLNFNAHRAHWHGILGGTYLFESHFSKSLTGFEIGLNRHFSSCTHSHYLNSFSVNYLFNENYKEYGVSYANRIFKKATWIGHGGWNLLCKINPNLAKINSKSVYLLKPGIGALLYSGARLHFTVVQLFALYNYTIYFQKNQNVNNMSNHSIQLGLFIGFNAIQIRPNPNYSLHL